MSSRSLSSDASIRSLLNAVFGLAFTRLFAFADALPGAFARNTPAITSRGCDDENCALRMRCPGPGAVPTLLYVQYRSAAAVRLMIRGLSGFPLEDEPLTPGTRLPPGSRATKRGLSQWRRADGRLSGSLGTCGTREGPSGH